MLKILDLLDERAEAIGTRLEKKGPDGGYPTKDPA
jgi:hypothetical protein